MQVGRPVGVHHPFWLARGAAGIAEAHGGVFVDLRPVVLGGLTRNEVLIVVSARKAGLAPFTVTADDDPLNRGHFVHKRLQQWQ